MKIASIEIGAGHQGTCLGCHETECRTWIFRHFRLLLSAFAVTAIILTGMTLSADEPEWRFVVVGDSPGTPDSNTGISPYLANVAQAIANESPKVDFVLFPGDLISDRKLPNTTPPSLDQQYANWFDAMAPIYDAGIPVYPVRGNHETETKAFGFSTNDPQPFLDAFSAFDYIPSNGPADATRLTYSFQHKNCLVLGLDLYINSVPEPITGTINPEVPQSWVDQQLATNQKPHVFTFGHTAIVQVSMNSIIARDSTMGMADAFFDSLVNAGSKVYFCGHDHFYNRSILERNGKRLCQLLGGNGGASLEFWKTGSYSSDYPDCNIGAQFCFHDQTTFGYCVVTVSSDNSISTVMKFLDTPTASAVTAFDAFAFNYSQCATAGMSSSLKIPAASNSKTTAQGTYTDPVKGGEKKTRKETLKSSPPPSIFPYQWSNKIVLYSKKLWDATITAEENLQEHPIAPLDCEMVVDVDGTSGAPETISYLPPSITATINVANEHQIDLPLTPGETIFVNGFYFGVKPPKAWLEYTKNGKVAKLRLKMEKYLNYPDAKGRPNKSCMDLTNGESSIKLSVPKAWPRDWNPQENHNIVIDNGLGVATMNFSEQPTGTPPE